MVIAFDSDVGNVRSENQDRCDAFFVDGTPFAVVADGMGGTNGGSIASTITVECVKRIITQEYSQKMSIGTLVELFNQCCKTANAEVFDYAKKESSLDGMGTTLVLLTIHNGRIIILNVGDSRAYFVKDKTIKKLTKDQSYVQQLIDKGEINESEAKNHPRKNIIMQAIGASTNVLSDIYELPYQSESLLLCSDGLYNKVLEKDIAKVINDKELCAQEIVKKLIRMANDAGGEDNISVVLIMNEK